MERAGSTTPDDDRCYNLRWNGMFYETMRDPKDPHRSNHVFWCHRTQNCLGPDSKIADEYECNETRKCYQAL